MKYRKKPVIVEAEKYHKGLEDGFFACGHCPTAKFEVGDDDCSECPSGRPYIATLEGNMVISPGDYIITGVRGERYPCKPDIFQATYEPVGKRTGGLWVRGLGWVTKKS